MPLKQLLNQGSSNHGDNGVQQHAGLQPATSTRHAAGHASRSSRLLQTALASEPPAGPTPGALVAPKPVQERAGQAPVGLAIHQDPIAVRAGQAPMATTAGQAPVANAGQVTVAARGGSPAKGGMIGAPGKAGAVGRGAKGGAAGPSVIGGSDMAGAEIRADADGADEQGQPDTTGEPPMMAENVDATYNHHSVYHWTNPFIVRATETVFCILIVMALIHADLPMKTSVWIHFNLASPTVPISVMFGLAALYHRNPLDQYFTLILLGFSLFCYVSSFAQILARWPEITRNRSHLPGIWVTIVNFNGAIILTLIVDIVLYASFLSGCPCFELWRKRFHGKEGGASKRRQEKRWQEQE